MSNDILVTIFIPVYNGEKYLEETLESIRNQTYNNFEVLMVDDSSTDISLQILRKFELEDSRFKVFKKENGGMVAISWNFILPKIKGQFVFYSSQDDIFSIDLLEKMIEKQRESGADTVLPEMEFYYKNHNDNIKIVGLNGNKEIELTGREALVQSLNWTIHGFALTSIHLFNNEIFPENAFDSDEFMTRKLFFKSNKVVFSEGIFFYRQDNIIAITKTFTSKNFYELNTLKTLFNFLKANKFENHYLIDLHHYTLKIFLKYYKLQSRFDFKDVEEKLKVKVYLNDYKSNFLNKNKFYLNKDKLNLKLIVKIIFNRVVLFNNLTLKSAVFLHFNKIF